MLGYKEKEKLVKIFKILMSLLLEVLDINRGKRIGERKDVHFVELIELLVRWPIYCNTYSLSFRFTFS